jgi:hypothetical protein
MVWGVCSDRYVCRCMCAYTYVGGDAWVAERVCDTLRVMRTCRANGVRNP